VNLLLEQGIPVNVATCLLPPGILSKRTQSIHEADRVCTCEVHANILLTVDGRVHVLVAMYQLSANVAVSQKRLAAKAKRLLGEHARWSASQHWKQEIDSGYGQAGTAAKAFCADTDRI